jgi:hypothetical protein
MEGIAAYHSGPTLTGAQLEAVRAEIAGGVQ